MTSSKKNKTQSVALVLLLATTFLPVTDKFNIFKIVILFVLCIQNSKNFTNSIISKKGKQIISLWFCSIVVAATSVLIFEGSVNQSVVFHEIARLVYYILVIYLCAKLRVSLKFLFYCCVLVLGIHFVIQVTQYLRLGTFNHFIETYYLAGNTDSVHYQLATKEYYAFRSGSIFINPNVYVCYPYLSLAVFLEYNKRSKSILPLLMILIAFISVVLTGSRMGLGAFIIICGWYFLFGSKNRKTGTHHNAKSLVFITVLLILLIFNWERFASFTGEMRAFSLDEAYSGSGATKLGGLIAYLTLCNPLYWITGSLGSNLFNFQIDMEFGYIFAWFGIIGMIWYIQLIKVIYNNNRKDFKVISTIAALSILLTAIGASSVLNMSVFPYACCIALTTITD